MADESESSSNRISILYLMAVTAGVAMAFSISRAIAYLRFPADSKYYLLSEFPEPQLSDLLVAAIYGICVVTVIFAFRAPGFWKSPGKILALLLAVMCILNWILDFYSAAVISVRFGKEIAPEIFGNEGASVVVDDRGYLFGIWYRNFAPSVGYLLALPVILFVIAKTYRGGLAWWSVWFGFLVFAILMAGQSHLNLAQYGPPLIGHWYLEIAVGIPVLLLVMAIAIAVIRREKIDWWTSVVSSLLVAGWAGLVGLKFISG